MTKLSSALNNAVVKSPGMLQLRATAVAHWWHSFGFKIYLPKYSFTLISKENTIFIKVLNCTVENGPSLYPTSQFWLNVLTYIYLISADIE